MRFIKFTMIGTKRTAALIATLSLLGTVVPAAFAQNTSVNTDDDLAVQGNQIDQDQAAFNAAAAGNGGSGITAGNNAVAFSLQNQDADARNTNNDNDVVTTPQVDVCAAVLVGIIC
jgi:hypothetical protein